MRRIAMTSGSSTSYYAYDQLGSTVNLTSSTGATQWTWGYEPYGLTRTEIKASGSQPTNLMKFTGEYLDPTGLYHLRPRQFDPLTGRFLSIDPKERRKETPVVGSYVYVENSPTIQIDPSGETAEPSTAGQLAARATVSPVATPSSAFEVPLYEIPRKTRELTSYSNSQTAAVDCGSFEVALRTANLQTHCEVRAKLTSRGLGYNVTARVVHSRTRRQEDLTVGFGEVSYMVPTDTGWVCYAIGGRGARCVPSLPYGISWSSLPLQNGNTESIMVYGIAADDVAAVWAVIDDQRVAAKVNRNAFFAIYAGATSRALVAFEIELTDGRQVNVAVP